MTIFAAAAQNDFGLVWIDSETYIDDEIADVRHHKMGVFPVSGLLTFGNGKAKMGTIARMAVEGCVDFDDAVEVLPGVLRRGFHELLQDCKKGEIPLDASSTFGVLGFSSRFQQMLIAEFCSSIEYRPRYCRQTSQPMVDFNNALHDREVLDLAEQQIAALNLTLPCATGGALVIARIKGTGLSLRRYDEFQKLFLRGSLNL